MVHCNLNIECNFLLFPYYYYATVCAINRNWKRIKKGNGENRSRLLEEYTLNSDNANINQDGVYSLMRKHSDGTADKYAKGRSADVYSSEERDKLRKRHSALKTREKGMEEISGALKLRASRNYQRSPFQLGSSLLSTLNTAHSSRRLRVQQI